MSLYNKILNKPRKDKKSPFLISNHRNPNRCFFYKNIKNLKTYISHPNVKNKSKQKSLGW